MIASLVIVFREMLEMVLVVGILLAATRGLPGAKRWIGIGISGGLVGALFFAFFMAELESSFEGEGEFIFNAAVLLLASIMIAWTVFWMNLHGREISYRMKEVGSSVKEGDLPYTALMIVAFSAVMREGAEAAFFLFGASQSINEDGWSMFIGGLAGAGAGLLIGVLVYFSLVRVPVKQLFSVASWLLMLLAAGMASQATWNLVVIEWLPPLVDPLWNSASLLSSESMAGEILRVMIGYDDAPSGLQVIVFSLSLAIMIALYYRFQSRTPRQKRT